MKLLLKCLLFISMTGWHCVQANDNNNSKKSNNNNGYSWDKPASAMLTFDVNHCSLENPLSYVAQLSAQQIRNVRGFEDLHENCSARFDSFYSAFTTFNINDDWYSHFNVHHTHNCSGTFAWQIGTTDLQDEGKFTDGKLLCNNGAILAFLGKISTSSYLLYYATNTKDDEVNAKSGYAHLSQSLTPEIGQDYCLSMYDVMTKLLTQNVTSGVLDNNLQCGQYYPPERPSSLPAGQCLGTATPCATMFEGCCLRQGPEPSCHDRSRMCRSEATCGQQDGCYCLFDRNPDIMCQGYHSCGGNATACSYFDNDRTNCEQQLGCSWSQNGLRREARHHRTPLSQTVLPQTTTWPPTAPLPAIPHPTLRPRLQLPHSLQNPWNEAHQ